MTEDLENIIVNNARVNANLNIILTGNPILHIPKIVPDNIEIVTSDWSGKTYGINLALLACTCPDHRKNRSSFLENDPRRVCKHLRQKLVQSNLYERQDDLCKSIIESGWVEKEFYTFRVNENSQIAFMYGDGEWINIYVRNRNPSDRYGEYTGKFNAYGLSKSGDYWTYGLAPPGAIMIKELLSYNNII